MPPVGKPDMAPISSAKNFAPGILKKNPPLDGAAVGETPIGNGNSAKRFAPGIVKKQPPPPITPPPAVVPPIAPVVPAGSATAVTLPPKGTDAPFTSLTNATPPKLGQSVFEGLQPSSTYASQPYSTTAPLIDYSPPLLKNALANGLPPADNRPTGAGVVDLSTREALKAPPPVPVNETPEEIAGNIARTINSVQIMKP